MNSYDCRKNNIDDSNKVLYIRWWHVIVATTSSTAKLRDPLRYLVISLGFVGSSSQCVSIKLRQLQFLYQCWNLSPLIATGDMADYNGIDSRKDKFSILFPRHNNINIKVLPEHCTNFGIWRQRSWKCHLSEIICNCSQCRDKKKEKGIYYRKKGDVLSSFWVYDFLTGIPMNPAQDISLCSIVPYREADQIGRPYQILNKDVDFTDILCKSCFENNTYYYVGLDLDFREKKHYKVDFPAIFSFPYYR